MSEVDVEGAPEVLATREQVAALPSHYRVVLEDAAVTASRARALHRVHAEAVASQRAARAEALAAHDLAGAVAAESSLVALERLHRPEASAANGDPSVPYAAQAAARDAAAVSLLPLTQMDPAAVEAVFRLAGARLAQVRQDVVDARGDVSLDWQAEVAVWRQLPAVQADAVEPPAASPADSLAKRAADVFDGEVRALADNFDVVLRGLPANPLSATATAVELEERARRLAVRGREVAEQIEAANGERRRAGLTWSPPAQMAAASR